MADENTTHHLLGTRADLLSESETTSMARRAHEFAALGYEVTDLSAGVPDFDTPHEIKDAASEALSLGYTKYTPIAGTAFLRTAVAEKLKRENNIHYEPDEIVITNGVKQGLANVCLAMLNPGDEVIVIAPFWTAYPLLIHFVGAKPVVVHTRMENGFQLDVDAIENSVTERTRLIMLNSPSNPSGVVYTRETLERVVSLCHRNPQLKILSDEIYEKIIFDGQHISPASLPGGRECTILLNGLSKSFSMTGWRVGYTAAPRPLAKKFAQVQGVLTAGVNSFSQYAAACALNKMSHLSDEMCQVYRERRAFVLSALKDIPKIQVRVPAGTFYVFPSVGAYLGGRVDNRRLETTRDIADYLLEKALVAVVPGSAFGNTECIRMNFSVSQENLEKGMRKFVSALDAIETA